MAAAALKKEGVDGLGGPAVSGTAMTGWGRADGSLAMMVGITYLFFEVAGDFGGVEELVYFGGLFEGGIGQEF